MTKSIQQLRDKITHSNRAKIESIIREIQALDNRLDLKTQNSIRNFL